MSREKITASGASEPPARTTVGAALPGILVEIDCIAMIGVS